MNDQLLARARAQDGVFSAADATGYGIDSSRLRALVRARTVVRVAKGLYAVREPESLTAEAAHLRLTKAMLLRWSGRALASHHSALLLHGLPVFGADLSIAHLCARSGTNPRRYPAVAVHLPVEPEFCGQVGQWASVGPAFAIVQTAMDSGFVSGVVAADAALHRRLVTPEELRRAAGAVEGWPGAVTARQVVEAADGRSESVGESRLRVDMVADRIDLVPQVLIKDGDVPVARVDFLVRGTRVVVEFDGLMKYRGPDGKAALIAEKRREDRLRALGYVVIRVTWAELQRPQLIARRIRTAVAAAAARA